MDKEINNYKGIIISGDNEGDVDGKCDFIGHKDEYEYHIDALLDYALKKYPDVQVFKIIPGNCEPNVPIYFLTALNNIVYLNVSSQKLGKYGMLFLPDEISLKQKEVLYDLASKLSDVNVDIFYDMSFDDGLVYSQEFNCLRGLEFKNILDDYFKTINAKKPNY